MLMRINFRVESESIYTLVLLFLATDNYLYEIARSQCLNEHRSSSDGYTQTF